MAYMSIQAYAPPRSIRRIWDVRSYGTPFFFRVLGSSLSICSRLSTLTSLASESRGLVLPNLGQKKGVVRTRRRGFFLTIRTNFALSRVATHKQSALRWRL